MLMVVHQLGIQLMQQHLGLFVFSFVFHFNIKFYFSVDYDDDDGPSSFATLNPTTPSYSHLTDTLSNGLESSNPTGSSTITSSSGSLLGSTGEPATYV
jgi:hypothetical protein